MSTPARLVIVGARANGQLPVALESIAADPCVVTVALVDDDAALWGATVLGLPVIGGLEALGAQLPALRVTAAFIAIGDPRARGAIAQQCHALGLALPTFVHPAAYVSPQATLGEGSFIGAGVQVLPGAIVGPLARVNAGAVISHHVRLGYCNTVGPNATFTGRASTGDYAFIGAGSVLLNDVHVGDDATLGAGAVATRSLPSGVTAVGVPARPLTG